MYCHRIESRKAGVGGHGVRTPLKLQKNRGFLSNTCPEPLKNQASIHCLMGHIRIQHPNCGIRFRPLTSFNRIKSL